MKSTMEDKKNVHIGVIGCTDHSKRTLLYAIKKTLENINNKEVVEDYPYHFDIKAVDFNDDSKNNVLKKKRNRIK